MVGVILPEGVGADERSPLVSDTALIIVVLGVFPGLLQLPEKPLRLGSLVHLGNLAEVGKAPVTLIPAGKIAGVVKGVYPVLPLLSKLSKLLGRTFGFAVFFSQLGAEVLAQLSARAKARLRSRSRSLSCRIPEPAQAVFLLYPAIHIQHLFRRCLESV